MLPKSSQNRCEGLDPLRDIKGWLIAAGGFALVTPLFLWSAVSPWNLSRQVPTLDSALSASIVGHVSQHLIRGGRGFWDFGIFYPLKDMLCLSDPMITPSVLFAPFSGVLGAVARFNLYIYFAWYTTALGSWAYLRNRGFSCVCAFFGAFIVAFSPARLWHAGGHMHLFFQAGFPLTLLAIERACKPNSTKAWGVVFGLSLLAQVFAGFYILVIFSIWILFMAPATLYVASRGRDGALWLFCRKHGVHFIAWIALAVFLLLPVADHFRKFGESFPENLPEKLMPLSANLGSYFIVPSDPGRLLTVPGWLYTKATSAGNTSESTLFIGLIPATLLAVGVVLGFRAKLIGGHLSPPAFAYGIALAAAGATLLILSLGPVLATASGRHIRLPFYYLYMWIDSVRFFRAPARFGIGVQVAVGFGAAAGLALLQKYYLEQNRFRAAAVLPLAALAVVMLEYFPIVTVPKIDCTPDPFTLMLLSQARKEPFVSIPFNQETGMAQFAVHQTPMAEGYSGYGPAWRGVELDFFKKEFPSTHSLLLLERWGIRHVFLGIDAAPIQRAAANATPLFKKIWSEPGTGELFESLGQFPAFDEFISQSRMKWHADNLPPAINLLPSSRSYNEFEFDRTDSPIIPTVYTAIYFRACLSKPLNLREDCTITWTSKESLPERRKQHSLSFVVRADSQSHDVRIPLGSQIEWITCGQVTHISLRMGSQPDGTVSVERVKLEQVPVQWPLVSDN